MFPGYGAGPEEERVTYVQNLKIVFRRNQKRIWRVITIIEIALNHKRTKPIVIPTWNVGNKYEQTLLTTRSAVVILTAVARFARAMKYNNNNEHFG